MLAKWMSCLSWVQSCYRDTFFVKTDILKIAPSGGLIADLGLYFLDYTRKERWWAIECVLLQRCRSFGFRVLCAILSKNVEIVKLWYLMTYGDLWPDLKWLLYFRNDFWRSFECRLLRVATWPRSRVRRGDQALPRPGAYGAEQRSGAG